ncbi:replicative DNA helicase [Corallococcus silvisoli]|uniref:replicative DNA helicase n=1 Tax=Corallococcus silvisoli TaxID=2697031 RepID=UPI001376D59D|nr:DnaB-like helicase C-terminal domain-containing protein [Corallococcus silvisoli]NBD11811.1 AAA family ATPase [Corallococcus silvisoli]
MLRNHEAERAVIGCVLVGRASLDDCGHLPVDEFDHPMHRDVWEAVLRVHAARKPIDGLAVAEELKAAGKLAAIGTGIMDLEESCPILAHAASYAELVRQAAMRRRLDALLTEAARSNRSGKAPAEVALEASAKLAQLSSAVRERRRTFRDAMEVLLERFHEVRSGGYEHYLPTGIDVWDELLGGLERGKLEILCAYPSVGKGAVAGRILLNLAQGGRKCSLFSLEDPEIWLPKRHLAAKSGVPVRRLMEAQRLPEHYERNIEDVVMQSLEWGDNLLIDDRSGLTADQIGVAARQDVVQHGAQAIVVDNASEIDVSGSDDRHDVRTAHAVRVLRNVAKDLNVPVLLLMHLKKLGNTTKEPRYIRPNTELLKNSGAFAEAARKIVALWLDEDDRDSIIGTVLKQTEGEKDIDFAMPFRASAGLVESVGGRKRAGDTGYSQDNRGAA